MTTRRVDFSRPTSSPRAGWWLLLAGSLLLAGACALKQHWQDRAEAAQRRLDQAGHEAARRQAEDTARQAVTPAQARRLAQLRQQQAWPWQAALQVVDDAVAEPVYLLGLSLQPSAEDARAGSLKLEAQSPTWNDALAFVERLQQARAALAPQALGQPQLSSQQQALDAGTNAPVVRFVVAMPVSGGTLPQEGRPRP